jgi:transcriptional regulator with XRE-family HTH domain
MIDILKLKALIVERNMTQKEVAKRLGISIKVWYDRMKKRKL